MASLADAGLTDADARPARSGARAESCGSTSAHARSDGAGDARAAEPAIAARVLRQVLLMIVLCEVERTCLGDLCRDRAEALGPQRLLEHRLRTLQRVALLRRGPIGGGAV